MIDNELFEVEIPHDGMSEWIDIGERDWAIDQPGIGRGKLITFSVRGDGVQFGATPGWYFDIHDANNPSDYTSGYVESVGIGSIAMKSRGIKFTLPTNVMRYIRFAPRGDFTGGTFTVYAVLE